MEAARASTAAGKPPMLWACCEEIFDTPMAIAPTNPRANGAIRTENLCRHYRMGETLIRAVDGSSLDVRSGDFVALLRSSGSGKSSVLMLSASLDRTTSGSIVLQNKDLARLSTEELANCRLDVVGMVFQSFK